MNSRDKMEQHLTQQKARATKANGGCRYRGDNATMCAVGCLISGEQYTDRMEGMGAHKLAREYPHIVPEDISVMELRDWQTYHDGVYLADVNDDHSQRFSYQDWLAGVEADSPAKFKEHMINKYQEVKAA